MLPRPGQWQQKFPQILLRQRAQQALVRRGDVAAVYVERERGGRKGYELRQLRLGERQGNGELEVLSGLTGGESVALDPVAAGIAQRRQRDAQAPAGK